MSPVRFEAGAPVQHGRPIILVALRFEPSGSEGAVKNAVRDLAEAGWFGIWLADATGKLAETAAETARRAGLAVVAEPGDWPPAPHLLTAPTAAVAVDEASDAFAACFAGRRVIVGDEWVVDGLRRYLNLCDDPASWAATDAPEGWLALAGEGECGWFSGEGDEFRIELPPDSAGAMHLVDPESGDILGLVTPTPGEPFLIRADGEPLALYYGPNRYELDGYVTRPE